MKLSDTQLQDLASQLRCPQGNEGLKAGEMMNLTNNNIITKAINNLAINSGDTVLEIGPGNGSHVKTIAAINNVNYTGIDISQTMITQAKKLNDSLPNVAFQLADADVIPFGECHFNKLLTVNTIYFWAHPQDYAKEIARVLQPCGVVSVGFIPKSTMQHIPFAKFGFTLYDTLSVSTLLKNAGLQIVSEVLETEFVTSNSGMQIEREFVIVTAKKL